MPTNYGPVPKYHRQGGALQTMRNPSSYINMGAGHGAGAVVSDALGDFGKSLLDRARRERRAEEISFFNKLDRDVSQSGAQIATKHESDPHAFNTNWQKMLGNSGKDLPDDLKDKWQDELERKRLNYLGKIQENQRILREKERNGELVIDQERHLRDSLNSFRAGDLSIGSDGKTLRDDEGNPLFAGSEILEKYMLSLEARTDLSPQQKAKSGIKARREVMRQIYLGNFDKELDKGLDQAKDHLNDLKKQSPPEWMDEDDWGKLQQEMQAEIMRAQRGEIDRIRGNRGEADRIMKNNLARIESGEDVDPMAEERIRGLVGDDIADEYAHNADRAQRRHNTQENLMFMSPRYAWELYEAQKPDPNAVNYGEDYEDWVSNGLALQKANKALTEDPAKYVGKQVEEEITQKQTMGASLYGAGLDDIRDAQIEASLRRQRELGIANPRLYDNKSRSELISQFEAGLTDDRLSFLANLQASMRGHWPQAMRELQEAGLPPEAGHAAMLGLASSHSAKTILEGLAVRELEPQFNPTNGESLRTALNKRLPPDALAGFSPEFNKGLQDTVLSAYAKLSKDGDDITKEVNDDRLKSAVDMVTGGVVEYDRPGLGDNSLITLAPIPSMGSDQFTDLVDSLTDDYVGEIHTPDTGGIVTLDEIREYVKFSALGNGKYGLTINGIPLVRGDGNVAELDLAKFYHQQHSLGEGN